MGTATLPVGDKPGFVLCLPPTFASWDDLPPNPLIGCTGTNMDDLTRDDFRFYCDSCQKGFNNARQFDSHMDDHVWCTHEGCKFTCRKDKQWKMELHVASLHNRPDAPDLANTDAYLASRRRRFPTKDHVEKKVEEFFYRAAKGELLPDERRRWLKQHGVFVSKKPNVPVMREGDAALVEARARHAQRRCRAEAGDAPDAEPRTARAPAAVRQKMIPLGPNGRFTKSQLVQIVRERYQTAQRVPAFYVCNRCGEKGHWVDDCPTAGDSAFDATNRWAAPRQNEAVSVPVAGPTDPAGDAASASSSSTSSSATSSDSDEAPCEADASKPLKPEQASVVKAAPRAHVSSHRRAMARAARPPTLFERLTEDEQISERGLLLQALRYFVHADFFAEAPQQPAEAPPADEGIAVQTSRRKYVPPSVDV